MTKLVAWVAYIHPDTGQISHITSPRGNGAPEEGLNEEGVMIKHITPEDVESLNMQNVGKFLDTHHWSEGSWFNRGNKPSRFHNWSFDSNSWSYLSDNFMQEVRGYRTGLLKATDWTQVNDSPLGAQRRSDYALYRQQLRDFPDTVDLSGEPTDVSSLNWPTEP